MRPAVVIAALAAAVLACGAASAKDRREAQLEDLAATRSDYVMKSAAFTPAGRARALAHIARLERRAGEMTDMEFFTGVARIAPYADNEHDGFSPGAGAWIPPLRAPFRTIWFPDGLVIAHAAEAQAELRGARILRLEGLTPAQLSQRLKALCGCTDNYLRWNVNWLMESAGVLKALGIARSPDALELDLKLADGRRVHRTLAFIPRGVAPPGIDPYRTWSKTPWPGEAEKGWGAPRPERTTPLYLQDPEALWRTAELPELGALYVQFRSNLDEGDQKIAPFVAQVSARLKAAPPENLILDLRFDTGGDIMETRELMRQIAARVRGRIYLLVGRYTFSAGIASAAALKHDGGRRVTIVGEGVGDRLRFWSEGRTQCLPNSHLCMRVTDGMWDLTRGCAGQAGCYGDQFDARVDSLEPDIAAPLTASAWLEDRDPGLAAVEADLRADARPRG